MEFDPRTLFLVHAVTSLTLAGMLFAFWRVHRSMSWLGFWAVGDALLGVGTFSITLRDAIPDTLSIVAANIANAAGAIVIWNGIRVFNGRRPRWKAPLAALPLFVLALAYLTYVENNLAIRVSLVTGTLAVATSLCAYELFRFAPRPLPRMAFVAGVPLVLDTTALIARAILALTLAPASNLMTAGGSVSLLVPLIGRIMTSFGFVVMTAERYVEQRRELEAQLFQSQKMEALGTLAGGVAHDLNNMLVPILALAKITALRVPEGSRERDNLTTILKASERARDLVSQVLAFSRKQDPMLRPVDLAAVARESLKLLRASLPATISIEDSIAAVPPLLGDPGKLQQVIANLVANAAHAIGDRYGTIALEVAETPGAGSAAWPPRGAAAPALRLTVRDDGCGMDPATAARIFDPFFTTKPAGAGTGLGLSVVHGIIDQHGGRIAVESAVGRGTRFDIYLPADPSALALEPRRGAASAA